MSEGFCGAAHKATASHAREDMAQVSPARGLTGGLTNGDCQANDRDEIEVARDASGVCGHDSPNQEGCGDANLIEVDSHLSDTSEHEHSLGGARGAGPSDKRETDRCGESALVCAKPGGGEQWRGALEHGLRRADQNGACRDL